MTAFSLAISYRQLTFRKKGFTLVELLIVIAILGVLAVVVLLAINPVQQLARTRDAGRISGVTQLGHAMEAYATGTSGVYAPEAGTGCTPATWVGCLVGAGEITAVPSAIAYSVSGIVACTFSVQNGTCYNATTASGGAPVIIYARLESQSQNGKCASGTPEAYAVYSTADGRGGVVCRAIGSEPVPGTQTFTN